MFAKNEKMQPKENVIAVLSRGNKKKVIKETFWTKFIQFLRRTFR